MVPWQRAGVRGIAHNQSIAKITRHFGMRIRYDFRSFPYCLFEAELLLSHDF